MAVQDVTNFILQVGTWHGQLNLSWDQGSGSTGTLIRRRELTPPILVTDGDAVASGSITSFIDINLDVDVVYYYKAFAYSGSTYTSGILSTPAGLPGTTKKPYTKTIWQPSDITNHPDLRANISNGSGSIAVYINGVRAFRVLSYEDFSDNSQFFINVKEDKTVQIVLNPDFEASGSTITYNYTTMCQCVNPKEMQPDFRCGICYGTLWEGGFTYYQSVAESWKRENSLLVVFPPVKEDWRIDDIQGKTKSEITNTLD